MPSMMLVDPDCSATVTMQAVSYSEMHHALIGIQISKPPVPV
jgi:hypothetical protein